MPRVPTIREQVEDYCREYIEREFGHLGVSYPNRREVKYHLGRPCVPMIGGTNNGRVFIFTSGQAGDILNILISPLTAVGSGEDGPLYEWERYRLLFVRGHGDSFPLWVHESLNINDAIARLIDAYDSLKPEADD